MDSSSYRNQAYHQMNWIYSFISWYRWTLVYRSTYHCSYQSGCRSLWFGWTFPLLFGIIFILDNLYSTSLTINHHQTNATIAKVYWTSLELN